MRRPVVADQPGAVHAEGDVQVLQADVVHDLVVAALQEGRVDGGDRAQALERETGREQHRMLLGDAHVEVLVGHLGGQVREAGAAGHRGGDAHHARIAQRLRHHRAAEDIGVLRGRLGPDARALGLALGRDRRTALADGARLRGVPLLHALEAAVLGRSKALALDGLDVHHDRPAGAERLLQGAAHGAHVVAVDHPDVGQVELLEQEPRRPEGLQRLLQLRAEALDLAADAGGELREPRLDGLARLVALGVQPQPVEVARQRADVGRDRHAVVVQHDHDRRFEAARIQQRLEVDAARHRAVADNRDHPRIGMLVRRKPELRAQAHRLLDPDRVARGRGRVAGAHDVVRRLGARAEGRKAAVFADARQLVAAAGQDLVRVGLVADVPEDLVLRRVEHAVQRDRQLAGAEVGAEVAADLPDRVDDVLAHLLREPLELVLVEFLQVVRAIHPVEQRALGVGGGIGHGSAPRHALRLNMKSATCSRSEGSPASSGRAPSSSARARACDSAASAWARSSPNTLT